MFKFFRKKSNADEPSPPEPTALPEATAMPDGAPTESPAATPWWVRLAGKMGGARDEPMPVPFEPIEEPPPEAFADEPPSFEPTLTPDAEAIEPTFEPLVEPSLEPEPEPAVADAIPAERRGWLDKLRTGLKQTGSNIARVFTGTKIDEALYEELEEALLMADAGVKATEYLLADLRRRVKEAKATDPAAVRELLADALAELLKPLEQSLVIGEQQPTVIMVAGVNGAGKTTTIGKLTRHLAAADCKVLLAAADTFRAAAREQLAVWADRNRVEIVSQEGGDPSAVSFDAVKAGIARRCDVVIADTAGRLPTQLHLMDELKKLKRTLDKALPGAPHEVLLVVDGNTGQNALNQVKAFDDALGLTGLVITKLDGTAKGGVLAALALWARDRSSGAVPVYFIGIGERLEDLQTFSAREFAQALF